ncbi:hypothetical protein ACFE04_024269 [Oxalis oulophora]
MCKKPSFLPLLLCEKHSCLLSGIGHVLLHGGSSHIIQASSLLLAIKHEKANDTFDRPNRLSLADVELRDILIKTFNEEMVMHDLLNDSVLEKFKLSATLEEGSLLKEVKVIMINRGTSSKSAKARYVKAKAQKMAFMTIDVEVKHLGMLQLELELRSIWDDLTLLKEEKEQVVEDEEIIKGELLAISWNFLCSLERGWRLKLVRSLMIL